MGKKKEDPFALTHLERETLHLQIENTRDKIRRRRASTALLRLEEALAQKKEARANAIWRLERSLEGQRSLQEETESSIPDMERHRRSAQEGRLRELAQRVLRLERGAQGLRTAGLREELAQEEQHDAGRLAQRIACAEARLAAPREEELLRKRREDSLRTEMADIFQSKAEAHQAVLRRRLDPIHLRIGEESRWYRDSEHILRTLRERLRKEGEAAQGGKETIRARSREVGAKELRARREALERNGAGLRGAAEAQAQKEAECGRLKAQAQDAQAALEEARGELALSLSEASLEGELARLRHAGRLLAQVRERAEGKVRAELEHVEGLDDPRKNLFRELLLILEGDIHQHLKTL